MMQIPDSLVNQFISNPVFKTDTRAIFFLLQNPEPVSSDDIAAATGLSRKCANKAVKRLSGAGLIQPGEIESRKRTFDVTGWEPVEPQTATEGTIKESLETLAEKVGRLQTTIESLTDALGAVLNPAPLHGGQNMTGIMPVCSPNGQNIAAAVHIPSTANPDNTIDGIEQAANMTGTATAQAIEKTAEPIQAIMVLENIPNESKALSVIPEKDTNGTTDDTIVSDLDGAIKYAGARLAAVKAASLLKEKANSSFSDTCAPARAEDTFRELFGVNVPPGFTDMAAVGVMIARKKAGKLDNIKSPLGYLASIAGKVQPIVTTPAQLPPSPMGSVINNSLPDNGLDEFVRRNQIKTAWFDMTAEQRIPFHELREKKAMSGIPGRKVPVELLAFQQFTQECLAGRVHI